MKKLQLKKEVVSELNRDELGKLAGGSSVACVTVGVRTATWVASKMICEEKIKDARKMSDGDMTCENSEPNPNWSLNSCLYTC